MNVHELGTWLLACPDQELPACTVNQSGDAREITKIRLMPKDGGSGANSKKRIELE